MRPSARPIESSNRCWTGWASASRSGPAASMVWPFRHAGRTPRKWLWPREGVMSLRQNLARLSGYAPALPTPFNDAGEVDVAALEHLCDRQIQEGVSALVV